MKGKLRQYYSQKHPLVKKNGKYIHEYRETVSPEELELMEEMKKNHRFYHQAKFRFNDSLDSPRANSYRWK